MQAPELLLRRPADPAVARAQLERAGLPADQREPSLAVDRDMAKSLADDAVERQVVVLLHQPVPAPVLPRARVGRTVTARRSMGESRTGSVAMSGTLPHPSSAHPVRPADNKFALRAV